MPDIRLINAKERFRKDKYIFWIIGATITGVLMVIHYAKTNDLYGLWRPVAAVFFPIGVLYMIMEVFQTAALKVTKDDLSLLVFRILGIIIGLIIVFIVATLWWKRISFSV